MNHCSTVFLDHHHITQVNYYSIGLLQLVRDQVYTKSQAQEPLGQRSDQFDQLCWLSLPTESIFFSEPSMGLPMPMSPVLPSGEGKSAPRPRCS